MYCSLTLVLHLSSFGVFVSYGVVVSLQPVGFIREQSNVLARQVSTEFIFPTSFLKISTLFFLFLKVNALCKISIVEFWLLIKLTHYMSSLILVVKSNCHVLNTRYAFICSYGESFCIHQVSKMDFKCCRFYNKLFGLYVL